jgi:hypothetical protein
MKPRGQWPEKFGNNWFRVFLYRFQVHEISTVSLRTCKLLYNELYERAKSPTFKITFSFSCMNFCSNGDTDQCVHLG